MIFNFKIRCDNRTECSVEATSGPFQEDPCQKTFKYLEAHYYCHNGTLVKGITFTRLESYNDPHPSTSLKNDLTP